MGAGKAVLGAMWAFNGLVLFMNERYGGYEWGDMGLGLGFMVRVLEVYLCKGENC